MMADNTNAPHAGNALSTNRQRPGRGARYIKQFAVTALVFAIGIALLLFGVGVSGMVQAVSLIAGTFSVLGALFFATLLMMALFEKTPHPATHA